jgi:hypothetical protein
MTIVESQLGMQQLAALMQALQQLAMPNYYTEVLLFTAPVTPTETDNLGTITEATFPGYARQKFTPGTVGFESGNDRGFWNSGTITFTQTGASSPQIITGWAICFFNTASAGTHEETLILGTFTPNLVMQYAGDSIPLQPSIYFKHGD